MLKFVFGNGSRRRSRRAGQNFAPACVLALSLVCPGGAMAAQKEFVLTARGAVGDGTTLNTMAIQRAIDQCAAQGGGTLVVPKGTFMTGSLFFKPGVNLHLEAGGVLKGSQNTNDYPWIDTRIAGLEMKWPAALINADGVDGFELSGPGTLDGSGERWWREYWDTRRKEQDDVDPHFKVGRPRLVHVIRSKHVVVRDLLLKNPAFWNLQLTYCDGILISNVTVRAHNPTLRAASSDGIDIDSSRDALIVGCDIECDDDGICLKSGRDADGLRVNKPTENVVVRNCRVGPAAGLVVIGSETSGGIRHVRVYDCRADNGCSEVVRFKTHSGRGGTVEDVVYENITAEGVRQVFNFNMDALGNTWLPEQFRQVVAPPRGTPVFRNITVRNVTAKNCGSAGRLVGLPESPLRDITLENIDLQARSGFTIRHAVGLHFHNVTLNGEPISAPAGSLIPETGGKPSAKAG